MKILPKIHDLTIEQINEGVVLTIIERAIQKRTFVITPLSIMGATGFPIQDQKEVLNNKRKVAKIKDILIDLSQKGILARRKSKQDFLGLKEVGYNYMRFK